MVAGNLFPSPITRPKPYFDFTEDEIKTRVKLALKPTSGELVTAIRNKPDLYAPFWIMFTLAFT